MPSAITRFAPSPTGYVHIGSIRTVLYDWLLARKTGGRFIVRIEDTDQARLVDGAIDDMLDVLDLFGLTPDESVRHGGPNGPYQQSQRLPIYQKSLHSLVEQGSAYYCFCTSERLEVLRAEQELLKLPPRYDGHCRNLPHEESKARVDAGEKYTIRLKVPVGETLSIDDAILGRVEFKTSEIDDQVLLKSDGFPTYHGAIILDDHLMEITHMLRGQEWISSIPKQILTARALNIQLPIYGHLPNILGKDGKKLSKRDGDVSARSFLERGYLVDALINYIAFLGWNPKTTQEIFTREELIESFSLEGINKAGATWDDDRLNWMNAQWMQKLPLEELVQRLEEYLKTYQGEFYSTIWSQASLELNTAIVRELKTRMKRFDEFPLLTGFLYRDPVRREDLMVSEKMKIASLSEAQEGLRVFMYALENFDLQGIEAFKTQTLAHIASMGKKNGQVLWPARVALSGEEFSPGAFEIASILGVSESKRRLEQYF